MTDHRKRDPKGRILPVSGWMAMETCPKDGSEFLAAVQVHHKNGAITWDRHIIAIDDETGGLGETYQGWDVTDYTHWHPIPKPPQGDAK